MKTTRVTRLTKVFVTVAVAVLLLTALSACGKDAEPTQPAAPAGSSALQGLDVARSALSTMAPDAKLLIVQTAEAVTPTATPVWAYLFGEPKTDVAYLVYVVNGEAMPASEYGETGLDEKQWAEVPETQTWKVDSTDAYEKALAVAGLGEAPAGWFMGFQTYVPQSKDQPAASKAMTWYVNFFDQAGQVAGNTVEVDANSGETSPTAAP